MTTWYTYILIVTVKIDKTPLLDEVNEKSVSDEDLI